MIVPPTTPLTNVTAVILAGGQGARFGGADKGFLSLHGRHFVEHAVNALAPQVRTLIISANRNTERYAALGYPVICDALNTFEGPLAGVSAGLQAAVTDWVLFAPVDAVRLPSRYGERLLDAAQSRATTAAVAHDGTSMIPVACLLHRSLASNLLAAYLAGQRSLYQWLRERDTVELKFDDQPLPVWSVNTPDELAALAHQTV